MKKKMIDKGQTLSEFAFIVSVVVALVFVVFLIQGNQIRSINDPFAKQVGENAKEAVDALTHARVDIPAPEGMTAEDQTQAGNTAIAAAEILNAYPITCTQDEFLPIFLTDTMLEEFTNDRSYKGHLNSDYMLEMKILDETCEEKLVTIADLFIKLFRKMEPLFRMLGKPAVEYVIKLVFNII